MSVFAPTDDQLLVRRLENESRSSTGRLVIPDRAQEKPLIGMVVAVGPGRWDQGKRVEMQVKVGDKVMFRKYGGTDVVFDGVDHLVIRESEVLGRISE